MEIKIKYKNKVNITLNFSMRQTWSPLRNKKSKGWNNDIVWHMIWYFDDESQKRIHRLTSSVPLSNMMLVSWVTM